MPAQKYPSIGYVRQCVREKDGRLFWLRRPREHFKTKRAWSAWNSRLAGTEAGGLRINAKARDARWVVRINNQHLYRYTIIWAMSKGKWVSGLDHRNRNPTDDRVENLRVASQTQNNANAKKRATNTSGYRGVTWDKANRKWIAQISVNRRCIKLGRFDNPTAAHAAYVKAAEQYFGDFANIDL